MHKQREKRKNLSYENEKELQIINVKHRRTTKLKKKCNLMSRSANKYILKQQRGRNPKEYNINNKKEITGRPF